MAPHVAAARRGRATLFAVAIATAVLLTSASPANGAIVPTVQLGTSANYSVLGGQTVTNTGNSVLAHSLGLWPGTSITGFPPGRVLPPGTTDAANAVAQQAQSNLTAAYVSAAGRPINATTTANLANLHLQAGVYAGPSHSPLSLTGPLVLDGAGDPNSVFIFQTNSTLITGSGSTVALINGAQECNVFWQVGSSATLGTGSVFTGNILALTSITVTNSVTVHGRALARNGAVTLDNDTFTTPTCAQLSSVTTAPTAAGGTAAAVPGGGIGAPAPSGGTATTVPGTGTATTAPGTGLGLTSRGPGVPGVVGPPVTGIAPLPTGGFPWLPVMFIAGLATLPTAGTILKRRVRTRGAPVDER